MHRSLALPLLIALVATLPALATDRGFNSRTELSAAQEVAPTDSDGRGTAVISFDDELDAFRVFVAYDDLVGSDVTRLHLHCNVAGANGPVAIGLIDDLNPANDNSDVVTEFGQLILGELTNADFPEDNGCEAVIGRPINNVASLAAAIDAGLVYWNLHTDVFAPGELRGQVRPLKEGRVILTSVGYGSAQPISEVEQTTQGENPYAIELDR